MSCLCLEIRSSEDIIVARLRSAETAQSLGFGMVDRTRIATAVSEITRNVVQHSGASGTISIRELREPPRVGIQIVVEDKGRGIADLEEAMRDGYSSGGGLGAGLPGTRLLMDEFVITSTVGEGTTVTMRKWLSGRRWA